MKITNDSEFKQSLKDLEYSKQRELAGLFVQSVIGLSNDDRIKRVAKVASDPEATPDELATALSTAKSAMIDCHARCGAEGDWRQQAGYFVARAATSAVTPEGQCRMGGPAWQSAMSSRMACTSIKIHSEEQCPGDESARQYRILSDYLNSQ
jgi:hypothetical protein